MRARAGSLDGIATLDETSSDSGMLDNATELLVRGGRDIRHALATEMPKELMSSLTSFLGKHVPGFPCTKSETAAPSLATTADSGPKKV